MLLGWKLCEISAHSSILQNPPPLPPNPCQPPSPRKHLHAIEPDIQTISGRDATKWFVFIFLQTYSLVFAKTYQIYIIVIFRSRENIIFMKFSRKCFGDNSSYLTVGMILRFSIYPAFRDFF